MLPRVGTKFDFGGYDNKIYCRGTWELSPKMRGSSYRKIATTMFHKKHDYS